ncbi:MAG: hypothetical protein J4G15_08385 [Alphaproteobacteria bacterium]|nr:hypothetical protein [Alphaproteobacteria bacterium]
MTSDCSLDPGRADVRPIRSDASAASKNTGLAVLRRHIAALERRSPGQAAPVDLPRSWRTGIEMLDGAEPAASGLILGGVHEAAGASPVDRPAALAFLAALLVRLGRHGPVAVCQGPGSVARLGRIYGPGWRDLGADPADLVIVETRRERDVLWAMEESLRSGATAAVLGEAEQLAFVASRRLALAAREGATPLLLLRGDGLAPASAAFSRWRVAAWPGSASPFDEAAPGLPRWRLELTRCRGGRPMTCIVEWNRETGSFDMAAALADRPAASRTATRRPALGRAVG